MKIKLIRNIRIGLITVLAILASINTYLIYKEVKIPIYETQMKPIYSYNNNGNVDYKIYLKPNSLYVGNSLGKDKLYISEYIDYLNANFNYEFIGESEANIQGEYNIIAKVEGIAERDEETITIWEKDFALVKNKKFSSPEGKVSINEVVKLYLNEYNTFVQGIIESSKISCQTTLTLAMDIHLNGTNKKGAFEEIITPNIIIPLNTPLFEIGGMPVIENAGAIEESIQVQLPIDRNKVTIYGIILGILTLGLIFLIFFTDIAPKKDLLEKEINKIFKKHGDRLVALNSTIDISNTINVRTIDDLVRLADEINRPILYKYSENYKEINQFFITNDEEVYVFDLEDLELKEEEKNTEEQTADGQE